MLVLSQGELLVADAPRPLLRLHCSQAESEKSENLFLYLDLPRFDFPVVFSEPVRPRPASFRVLRSALLTLPYPLQEYPLPVLSSLNLSSALSPTATAASAPSTSAQGASSSEPTLFTVIDPEIVRKNPVEAKHRRLVRDHRNGPLDRELKPNAKIRDELNVRPTLAARLLFASFLETY